MFRYLFGACGKISLPLAAIFCRVCATTYAYKHMNIILCVLYTFFACRKSAQFKTKRKDGQFSKILNSYHKEYAWCLHFIKNPGKFLLPYLIMLRNTNVKMTVAILNWNIYLVQNPKANFFLYSKLPTDLNIHVKCNMLKGNLRRYASSKFSCINHETHTTYWPCTVDWNCAHSSGARNF